MLTLISPAKTLDFETPTITKTFTQPGFLTESQQLIDILKTLTPSDISSLMGVSDKLAALNTARYADWSLPFTPDNAKQALLAFKGDVYTGLEAETLTQPQLEYAQRHLRILSGLYGILRPLDLIQPYRLEMGTKLGNTSGKDLYTFWYDAITQALNLELQRKPLVNLASNEYFKAVNTKNLNSTIITPVFKDLKGGTYKIISFYAKKARGMMSRYIIENAIDSPAGLLEFNTAGYAYSAGLSQPDTPVFTRETPEK